MAPKWAHKIQPGQQAQPLTAGDKLKYSIRDRASVGALADALWRAGWEQMMNSQPHYGTDSGAFGERLAASAFRQTASNILTNGVFAAALHDDPRYYVMGDGHPIAKRALYAGTRVFVTRNDEGKAVANIPRLATTVIMAGLNNLYYPPHDRGLDSSCTNALTSIALKAAGYEISEFIGDALHIVHRNR